MKVTGYLVMANCASYWGFMAAALIVAFGTGIFKPGIQGTIAALLAFGGLNSIWILVAAIVCFSLGEMLSSPKSSENLGNSNGGY